MFWLLKFNNKNELISRIDTDDICFPNKFELQVNVFLNNEALNVMDEK